MARFVLALFGLVLLSRASLAADSDSPPVPTAAEVAKNPDDVKAINDFLTGRFRDIAELMDDSPEKAETELAVVAKVLDELQPTTKEAKALVARGLAAVQSYRDQIELDRTPLAELETALLASPDDRTLLRKWTRKISSEISPTARLDPIRAEKLLAAAREFAAKLKEEAKNETTQTQIAALSQPRGPFVQFARAIKNGHEIVALIGQPAAPLKVESWLNGSPLTDEDLKGKVVMLDFWAVWCGPCIATFPKLRKWQAEYGERGLVIIGLTKYYDYEWDEEEQRAKRGEDSVSHEDEQAMLEKFVAHHKLKHRIALRDGEAMSEYYALMGIPHAVIIDQQGKIRMIRVGSGPKNVAAIDNLLAELLPAEGKAGGK